MPREYRPFKLGMFDAEARRHRNGVIGLALGGDDVAHFGGKSGRRGAKKQGKGEVQGAAHRSFIRQDIWKTALRPAGRARSLIRFPV
jgi:hypothetical protein